MEKLTALRLEGMAQALEEQRRQAEISQLDFGERFGLLVERQWLWRENRALAARLRQAQLKVAASLEDIDYRHPRGLKRAHWKRAQARRRHPASSGPGGGSGPDRIPACALKKASSRGPSTGR
jgi:hypothetical protein